MISTGMLFVTSTLSVIVSTALALIRSSTEAYLLGAVTATVTSFFNRQSPGSFPESSSGPDIERSRKISCCFPKGTVPPFL
jgi:hypothetical protein